MLTYEQYVFFCSCGLELRTKENKTAECKCGKKYVVESIPHKYLFPEKKGNKDNATNNKR
jgi:hypothetical protein